MAKNKIEEDIKTEEIATEQIEEDIKGKKNALYKVIQGELPQKINVVKDKQVIAKAVFVDGMYITDNKAVADELEAYGYEVVQGKTE